MKINLLTIMPDIIQTQLQQTKFPSVNLADNSKNLVIDCHTTPLAQYVIQMADIGFKIGDKFTIWFDVEETDNDTDLYLCGFYVGVNSVGGVNVKNRYTRTFEIYNPNVNTFRLFSGPSYDPYKYKTTFKNVCFVRGELPMQWMPSVNDIIKSAQPSE